MYNYSRSPGFYAKKILKMSIKRMKKKNEMSSVVDLIKIGRNCPSAIVQSDVSLYSTIIGQRFLSKIYVQYSPKGIQSIRFSYINSGKPIDGSLHGQSDNTYTQTFEINHLKHEHLESVEGYYTDDTGIQALQFKTNLRISEPMGYHDGCTKFILAIEGKKSLGFTDYLLRGGGIEAIGGKVGTKWDDGVDHAGFTKIHVRSGPKGIQYIKFLYVDKYGHLKDGPIHGSISGKVEGYYNDHDESGVIQALRFKTNIKTSELMGSNTGKKFRLAASEMKIVGFHGYAGKNLRSLGAYFTPITPTKLAWQGTALGTLWDHGAFQAVRKLSVFEIGGYITCLGITYDNDGKVEKRDHGMQDGYPGEEVEFVVDYPNEFITSVVGTMSTDRVASLTFKTSKGRTSQRFGDRTANLVEFVLENKDCAIVGFHGWWTPSYLTALGAYSFPMPLSPASEKLEAQGGDGGASWDDGGNYEGVRKICIGTGEIGIVSVKFLYENDTHEIVVGDHHGNKNLIKHEEFELDYPGEYLTLVEGSYDIVPGSEETEVIIMLMFTTNMRASPCYGLDDNPSFVLQKRGHKIVGFHGKSSNMLHQLGIHVLPITHP
ncbi:putative jacalin-like lectin domain-containing protein [Arabidopsis thaliana]